MGISIKKLPTQRDLPPILSAVRTKERGAGSRDVWILLRFKGDSRNFALRARPGHRIVSAMLNTVRFSPHILDVRTTTRGNVQRLEIMAQGEYVVAAFEARRTSEAESEDAFELTEYYGPTEDTP